LLQGRLQSRYGLPPRALSRLKPLPQVRGFRVMQQRLCAIRAQALLHNI